MKSTYTERKRNTLSPVTYYFTPAPVLFLMLNYLQQQKCTLHNILTSLKCKSEDASYNFNKVILRTQKLSCSCGPPGCAIRLLSTFP